MQIKSILSLAIAGVISLNSFTFAADGDKPKPEGDKPAGKKPEGGRAGGIKALDKNNDGKISKEEAAGNPRLSENFAKIDTNSDGQLDEAELKAAAPKKPAGDKKPEKKPDAK